MPARRSCEKVDLTPVMGHPGHRGGRTVRLVRARTRRLWTDSVGPARDSLPTLALRASRCALRAICESDGQPRPRTRIGDLPWPTISCVRTRHRHGQRLRRREAGEPDDAAGTLGTTVDSSATHADGKSAEGTSPGLLAARELARANGGDVVLAPQDRDAGVRSAASGATVTFTIRAESPTEA